MIKKTFSTETWGPDGEQTTKEWKKFKQDTLSARDHKMGPWIIKKLRALVGK